MRFSSFAALAACLVSTAACTVTTTGPDGEPVSEDTPTFSASDVRPAIEGTWNGTVNGRPLKVTLGYVKGGVSTQCSSRALAAPGSVHTACIDLSTLNLTGDIVLEDETTVVNGHLMVADRTFQNRGELTLQGAAKTTTRLNAVLSNGKLEGSLYLEEGKNIDVVLSR